MSSQSRDLLALKKMFGIDVGEANETTFKRSFRMPFLFLKIELGP